MIRNLVQLGLGTLAAIIPANIAISAELIAQNYPKNVTNAASDGIDRSLPANNSLRKPTKRPRWQRPIFTEPGRSKPFTGLINNQSTYNVNTPRQTTEGAGDQNNPDYQVAGASSPVRPPNQAAGAGSGARR
jgi:hypothetical protein